MKLRPATVFGLTFATVFFSVGLAFAQSPVPPPTSPNWVYVITAAIAFVAGAIGQAVNTGSFFGFETVPQAWIPFMTLGGSFLGAFGLSLQQSGSLSSTALQAAFVAGLASLGSAAAGTAAHTHYNAHKMFRKAKAMAAMAAMVAPPPTAAPPAAG